MFHATTLPVSGGYLLEYRARIVSKDDQGMMQTTVTRTTYTVANVSRAI